MIPHKRFEFFLPDWGMLRRSIRCVQIFLISGILSDFYSSGPYDGDLQQHSNME